MDKQYRCAGEVIGKFDATSDVPKFCLWFKQESRGLTHELKMQLFREAIAIDWYTDVLETEPDATTEWSLKDWMRELKDELMPNKVQRRRAILNRKQQEGEDASFMSKTYCASAGGTTRGLMHWSRSATSCSMCTQSTLRS